MLISRNRIRKMVKELGKRISNDYKGKEVLLIGVLNGAFIFLADLAREITLETEIDFIAVSSYGNSTNSTGIVKIIKDIDIDVNGKNVIIVEDIVDTGLTLSYLKELISNRKPESIKICAAFNKKARRMADIHIDYEGICIPDEFIVGYGLDYGGKYRNSPDIKIVPM